MYSFRVLWRSNYRDHLAKGHSRSLDMAPFDRPHTCSYSSSIVNMSPSSTVTEILSVEYWRDVEIWARRRSRSLKMMPIGRSYATLFWSAVVSIALFFLHHFRVIRRWKHRDLEIYVNGYGSLKMTPFDRSHTSSYSSSIVTVAISCSVFEIKRDFGRKTPICHTPLYLTCTIP